MFNGTKVFDVHGHVSSPPEARAYVAMLMASNTATRSPLQGGQRGPGLSDEAFQKASAEHAKYMDERNIDIQIIGPRPFMMLGWMQPHLLPAWTRFINDCIHKQVQDFPDRFLGAAQLPQIATADDIGHVIPELERCVNELGFIAAYVSPDPAGLRNSPGMHEPYWYPLYEKVQALGIPLIVHGTNCQDRRFGVVPQNYQLGFFSEQYFAYQFLDHSDVFDKFPELKVVICHCGGAIHRFIPTDNHLGQKDHTKNLFFDTCGYDVNFLEAAIKQRGVKSMLFGTEAPGSGRAIRPETGKSGDDLLPILAGYSFLTDADRTNIINTQPAAVFPAFNKVAVTA